MGHGPHVPLSRLPRRLAHKRCKASVRITESDYTCAEFLKAVRAGIHVEEVEEDCSSSDPPPLADVATPKIEDVFKDMGGHWTWHEESVTEEQFQSWARRLRPITYNHMLTVCCSAHYPPPRPSGTPSLVSRPRRFPRPPLLQQCRPRPSVLHPTSRCSSALLR